MTRYQFSKRSLDNLATVHPDLQLLAHAALKMSGVDFVVIQGLLTEEQQTTLVQAGASQTMNSKHLTGRAIDVAAYRGEAITWDWPPYEKIAHAFKNASAILNIPVVWGGNWRTFKDGGHFELA